MTYSIILKDTLPSGKIVYIVKYNDSKNYSFIYDTEQNQATLDSAVDKEVELEKLAKEAEDQIKKDQEEAEAKLKELEG
tara:strand:- start:351 stop:587 length:237 start_codon:yes stop_codon:yes gene_type:complete